MFTIRPITSESNELNMIRQLFKEYAETLNEDLCFQGFDLELINPLKKYGKPEGFLLLAVWHDEPIGCIALQSLKPVGVCEMKRLYVRDKYRNQGIGDQLIKDLIIKAKQLGYTKMVLDTLVKLQPAIRLYSKHGFVNTTAYYENPLQGVIYMEREI